MVSFGFFPLHFSLSIEAKLKQMTLKSRIVVCFQIVHFFVDIGLVIWYGFTRSNKGDFEVTRLNGFGMASVKRQMIMQGLTWDLAGTCCQIDDELTKMDCNANFVDIEVAGVLFVFAKNEFRIDIA